MRRMMPALLAIACSAGHGGFAQSAPDAGSRAVQLDLPAPQTSGAANLETTLARRRSLREFGPQALTRAQVGQLLWAAQGVTSPADGLRTAPSAGACFPLQLLVVGSDGVWLYDPATHRIRRVDPADRRVELATASMGQAAIREAPVSLVVTGVPARTRARYGARAERYVYFEAGHAAQNVLLQADALGLGAVPIGAFDDIALARLLALPDGVVPLYVIPVGHRR